MSEIQDNNPNNIPVTPTPANIPQDKPAEALEFQQVDAYLERYNPEGLTKAEGIDRLQVGMGQLKKITGSESDFNEILQDFKQYGNTQDGIETKKMLMSKILMAVDFLAKRQTGHLDAQNEVFGSSSYLFHDPEGRLNQLLMQCQPYHRISTHYSGYGAPKKGKYGVDFGSGQLPAGRDFGKLKPYNHCHFFAFQNAEGKNHIGIKYEQWGWHGNDLTSYFNKEKRAHNFGHVRNFLKSRPQIQQWGQKVQDWGKKIAQKTDRPQAEKNLSKVVTRRDTDKTLRKKADQLLSSAGVGRKKTSLENSVSNIKQFIGRVKELKISDIVENKEQYARMVQSAGQKALKRIKEMQLREVKNYSRSVWENVNHAIKEWLSGDQKEIEFSDKAKLEDEEKTGFREVIDSFYQTGRIQDLEGILNYMDDLSVLGKIPEKDIEKSSELREIIAERKQRMQNEGWESAPAMGNEVVFDLSNVTPDALDQYISGLDRDSHLY